MRQAAALVLTMALLGCATAAVRTDDPRRAVVLAPFMMPIGAFGRIHIPEGTVLYPSIVNSDASWCTTTAVYFAPGEGRAICLFDPKGGTQVEGWLKSAYITGTLSSIRYDVDVPYRVGQTAALPPR